MYFNIIQASYASIPTLLKSYKMNRSEWETVWCDRIFTNHNYCTVHLLGQSS